MAKKTVVVSDLTGQPVDRLAQVKVTVGADVWVVDADAADEPVATLIGAGRKTSRRGRKPKTA